MKNTPQTSTTQEGQTATGLSIRRYFTAPGRHPFDEVEWELRDARIGHGDKVSFEQRDVEFPKNWSQNATNIVAQKYFRGQLGSPTRERSVKQMIGRVATTIADWGRERGYFFSDEDGDTFEAELTHILLHQMAAIVLQVSPGFLIDVGRLRHHVGHDKGRGAVVGTIGAVAVGAHVATVEA